jgi:hypothetical protein
MQRAVGPTVASERLRSIVGGRKKSKLARAIRDRFHRDQLSRWCRGERRPELETLIELRKLARIKLDAWAEKVSPA